MPAYIISIVRVLDPERYAAYAAAIAGLSAQFGAEPVTKGPVVECLEGEAPAGETVVVSRFPDAQAARDYINSERYQAAKRLRDGAVEVVMRLVEP